MHAKAPLLMACIELNDDCQLKETKSVEDNFKLSVTFQIWLLNFTPCLEPPDLGEDSIGKFNFINLQLQNEVAQFEKTILFLTVLYSLLNIVYIHNNSIWIKK